MRARAVIALAIACAACAPLSHAPAPQPLADIPIELRRDVGAVD